VWYNGLGMENLASMLRADAWLARHPAKSGAGYQRPRWAVICHPGSGSVRCVDIFAKRLSILQRRCRAWVEIVDEWRKRYPLCRLLMVRLSYNPALGGYKPGDINRWLKSQKDRYGSDLLGWFWVAELHVNGEAVLHVHYHVLVFLKPHVHFVAPDAGSWPHGSSRVEVARSPWYLVKYAGKAAQKDLRRFPKRLRTYGVSIRFGGSQMRERYRALSGILAEVNAMPGEWVYGGSAATEGYRDDVLIPRVRAKMGCSPR